jgi:hypothetical protein
VVKLAGGEQKKFELALEAHPDAKSVAAAESAIAAIQTSAQPKVYERPTEPWAPA